MGPWLDVGGRSYSLEIGYASFHRSCGSYTPRVVTAIESRERQDGGGELMMSRRAAIARVIGVVAGTTFVGLTACRAGPRRSSGEVTLDAAPGFIDLGPGGRMAASLYDGTLPGPTLRVTEGTRLRVRYRSRLDAPSSIHWHGLPQRGSNAMDGVPGVTQRAVVSGDSFLYDFAAEPAGTYFFHSHFGLQIEHGLYAPLIIEPRREPLAYDRELVIVLDDWPALSPERMLANLVAGRPPIPGMNAPMAGMTAGGMTNVADVAAEVGPDVAYKTFLLNGRPPSDPAAFEVRRGDRVRIRLINAGAATAFRVRLAGHRLLVTHADGAPVRPVMVDTLEIAMGERYDAIVAADNPGTWALDARSADEPERFAHGVFRYAGALRADVQRDSVGGDAGSLLLRYADLVSEERALWSERPDRVLDVALKGQMVPYRWTIGDRPSPAPPLGIRAGELVEVRMRNESPMRHPMHLHGHSFRIRSGAFGARDTLLKDTASVEPGATLAFQFRADNPGAWLFHCHHAYHQEVGMMRVLQYLGD